jgi:hypothetical protein
MLGKQKMRKEEERSDADVEEELQAAISWNSGKKLQMRRLLWLL